MNEIVFDGERQAVEAGSAVVVIGRALLVVLVITGGRMASRFRAAAILMGVGAGRVFVMIGRQHPRVQPGENAEDQKPCEKVPHRCSSVKSSGGNFKGIRCFNFLAVARDVR